MSLNAKTDYKMNFFSILLCLKIKIELINKMLDVPNNQNQPYNQLQSHSLHPQRQIPQSFNQCPTMRVRSITRVLVFPVLFCRFSFVCELSFKIFIKPRCFILCIFLDHHNYSTSRFHIN